MNNILKSIIFLLTLTTFSGCGEYFDDPLIHKETGEEINLLVIDFNFFKTNLTYKLLDAETDELIMKEARIRFEGESASNIVTYAGERKPEFYTSEGMLELTMDPNFEVSESNPALFGVVVDVDGYEQFEKGFILSTEGKRTLELKLYKTADLVDEDGETTYDEDEETFHFIVPSTSLKSATVGSSSFDISFSMTLTDVAKLEGSSGKLFESKDDAYSHYLLYQKDFFNLNIAKNNNFSPEIDVLNESGEPRPVLFEKLERGECLGFKVAGKEVEGFGGGQMEAEAIWLGENSTELFGFYNYSEGLWESKGNAGVFYSPEFSYWLAHVLDDAVCSLGATITFSSNMKSGFSIGADLYDSEGSFIKSVNFTGDFGDSFILENMPRTALNMVFRNENPSFQALDPVLISDPCSGGIMIEVDLNPEFKEYQIVLKALCPEEPTVAIAPSYNAQVRIAGSEDEWQAVSMTSGIANIAGIPNKDYQMRLLWEDDWEYSEYSTKFDENHNYIGELESGSTITSYILEDKRIRLEITKTFDQNICDDMGW